MADTQPGAPKPTKACVNCRRQKMKCQIDDSPPCRRCKALKSECIFRPRANAAVIHRMPEISPSSTATATASFNFASSPVTATDQASILSRLDTIEALLGIKKVPNDMSTLDAEDDLDIALDESDDGDFPFAGVGKALTRLREMTKSAQDQNIWSKKVVRQLWRSFHTHLPLLHFLADRKTFFTPTPLLLASILYISSLHHNSAEYASLAPGYFAATCSAIADLVMPSPTFDLGDSSEFEFKADEIAFNDILGLIMASLSSEAFIDATGSWISIGYRLLLDHCPHLERGPLDWKGLFSGLQVIDVEHASIHLCYPLLPKQPPQQQLQNLDRSQDTAYRGLAQMMHSGLSHFVGRGLPSIWSFVSGKGSGKLVNSEWTFTDQDLQVIRRWAKGLDDWLVRYNGASQPSEADRHGILILLQYHLHKLFVLSIYHPARGHDLGAHNITSTEKHELLISARAILRLRENDTGIWSNWDLVMVTLAALLVLRGFEDRMANEDDIALVQSHLRSLQGSQRPAPSVQHVLADRLEKAVQNMHSPVSHSPELIMTNANLDYSYTIFDQNTLPLANPSWLIQDPLTMTTKHAVQLSPTETRSNIPGQYHSNTMVPPPQNDAQTFQTRQWIQDQTSNMWPANLHRLFGHDESQAGNGSLGS